jgi:biotin operon repressor
MSKILSDKKIARIKELSKKGLSQRAIAKKVGCSRSAVWYRLQK